jgi:hypothetical protein
VNNQAPELSPEARRIIGDARGADDPTAEDQSRVKARWLASVVAVAGVSSLTEAARAAGGIGWGLKVAGAALVMAAGAIGLYVALPSDAGRDMPHGAKSEAVARSGAIRGRFEKTPNGEHDALEGDAVKGHPRQANVREGNAELAAGEHAPTAAEAGPAASLAVPVIAAPSVAPVVDAVPRAETAQPAPSVLEPAEVPTREGSPLAVGVDAPATEAKAGPAVQVPTPAAARDSKGLRREPAAARAKPARAGAARAAPPSAEQGPLAPSAGSSKAANSQSGQLGEELTLLSEVRGSVQNGAPERALEQLARYRSRFSPPILGMEADALKVDALCKTGQREAARASARAFQNDWPGSPLERRVSAACP